VIEEGQDGRKTPATIGATMSQTIIDQSQRVDESIEVHMCEVKSLPL
jgi:hypothetical protein